MELPYLPTDFASVVKVFNKTTSPAELAKAAQPYKEYETKLRQIFAQQPHHEAAQKNHLVPLFGSEQQHLAIKARNLETESDAEKGKYILPLSNNKRRKDGSPATVTSIKDFKTNFNIFSEQSLVDLDWSNLVAAGSSVVTSLLPVDSPHNESKRALRTYYHEELAPASDVDLFIYGLNEEQAIEKIKQIEASIRDSILAETTTIRTKNAISIVSEYPTRHVQIVLRLYKTITEILTGFDVDCSCVAYDGQQVWASPRALAAFATQQNSIDLTRRSPSYENRLSKYSHRGFEVHWPPIDRERIDPTIYERSFKRVEGLARLLVLEKLPHPSDRDAYADKRRKERGRPDLPWNARYRHALPGNIKDAQPDDIPDWQEDVGHSDYNTFSVPYGPRFNAKKIEKLLFKKDLLLNAEWNKSKERETKLHRHPAFFGSVDDVLQDCCGLCPEPVTDEDLKMYEEESKLYISGTLKFLRDDPGRQAIGSFNPLTADDWTDMAYVGSSSRLCQAIVDNDIDAVKNWFGDEGSDVNHRDHTGRTPLQLACMCASPEIVQVLVERGARIVSRIYNGMTALHMAAHRGNAEIVKLLLDKSAANEEEEGRKAEVRKEARRAAAGIDKDVDMGQEESDKEEDDGDIEMIDSETDFDDEMTQGSFVKVENNQVEAESEDEPDVYDIDVLAWDNPLSALHLAVMAGHTDVIDLLIDEYDADVMLPVKLKDIYSRTRAILNLVLPTLTNTEQKANDVIRTLLSHGASPAQADANQISNLHFLVNETKTSFLDLIYEMKPEITKKVINHLVIDGWSWSPTTESPLLTAIRSGHPWLVRKVIQLGATPSIDFEAWAKAYSQKFDNGEKDPDELLKLFRNEVEQPIIEMTRKHGLVEVVGEVLDQDIDVNIITKRAHRYLIEERELQDQNLKTLLDLVRMKIKELKDYDGEPESKPRKLDALPEFQDPECGPYELWHLQTNYYQAENMQKAHLEAYERELEQFKTRPQEGLIEKKKAIEGMLKKWQALETKLCGKGAKTFVDLHPTAEKDASERGDSESGKITQMKVKPFENKVSFQVPDLTNTKRERYIKLFEAVFAGDEDTVKALCLDTEHPLQIAVLDTPGFTPFSLAVLRGHYSLARTVLDIAACQYQPPEGEKKTYRYSIQRHDHAESDDEDEDKVKFYPELIDEEYTIDDLQKLSDNVKSKTSPASLFETDCELWRVVKLDERRAKAIFQPAPGASGSCPLDFEENLPSTYYSERWTSEHYRNAFSLFRFAIVTQDMEMLRFLLETKKDLIYRKGENDSLHELQINTDDFNLALRLGRTDMITEIISRTGTLLPLANLAEGSGAYVEKPRYYQGLSCQHRQAWIEQDRGSTQKTYADHGSPLLAAVISGNVKSIEYFLSETPMRCYEEFAETFSEDKYIKSLANSEGGIERALHSWMDTRCHLAMHMAIMADPRNSKTVLDFMIKRMPQFINAKSREGFSPLHLAFHMRHYDAVETLIKAGADQTTRDKTGHNLLHTIYTREDRLDHAIEMLNPEIVFQLTLQRCSGDGADAQTPLMYFLTNNVSFDLDRDKDLSKFMELSRGKDLEVMDGAGDFPLHSLVRADEIQMKIVEFFARRRPDLLFKENATGNTPVEIVEISFYGAIMSMPPEIYADNSRADLTEVPKEQFVEGVEPEEPHGTSYPAKEYYRTISELAKENPRPRDLISLLDANETARRLAEQQSKANEELKQREARGLKSYRAHRYSPWDDDQKEDEVSLWYDEPMAERETIDKVDKESSPAGKPGGWVTWKS